MLRLSMEIADLTARTRAGTLAPAETQGGCLSIYQPGGTAGDGIGHFTPPVNAPEPAILGVSPAQREPVLDEHSGTGVHRLRMPLYAFPRDMRRTPASTRRPFVHHCTWNSAIGSVPHTKSRLKAMAASRCGAVSSGRI